jgi:amino acid transporter
VAVTLIQDYVLTISVSALSSGDQLLSILNAYGQNWVWHFLLGAIFAGVTWYLTIRGRGESAQVVFTIVGVFVLLTIAMGIGLLIAHLKGVPAIPLTEAPESASLSRALFQMLSGSMKGMVALTGLEAMSNGIQFVKNEDADIIKWGKKQLPRLNRLWGFYSGKSGIGRMVQTSFLFYGGLTTLFLTTFAIRFNVFDGTFGRTLVGNLASIGFEQFPGGVVLFWAYQILAVLMLSAASMTAFQDAQATEWRDVAIGEIPEFVVYRDPRGTFTRSVTATYIIAVLIMFLVRGRTNVAIPFYGIAVFVPIIAMGFAVRRHVLTHFTGRRRKWGSRGATFAAVVAVFVFIGQLIGKWNEGGWVALLAFSLLAVAAHLILLSPLGFRDPEQIHRIVREKARVEGGMASIVEWQALKIQEYRYSLIGRITLLAARFFGLFGVVRPMRYGGPPPVEAGDYDHAIHVDDPGAPSLLEPYLKRPDFEPDVTEEMEEEEVEDETAET